MHPARSTQLAASARAVCSRAALLLAISIPAALSGQSAKSRLSPEEIKALAAVQVAISVVQDSIDKQLAASANKKNSTQAELREKMRTQVGAILTRNSLTDSAYQRRRFLISTDSTSRKIYEVAYATLSGVPTPGQVAVVPIPPPTMAVPANAMGMHIGHVVNSFGDTPDKSGLLTMANTEARIAQQHAALAMRATGNLAMMQLHAGHVINALDPTIVTAGPGKGYGVKKAATNIATHIELAGKAEGANPMALMHSTHIAASARSTVARADQIIALAKQIQASTDAPAAAALLSQMSAMCDQLTAGADANTDGKIDWNAPEGGLMQVQQHVALMLGADKKP